MAGDLFIYEVKTKRKKISLPILLNALSITTSFSEDVAYQRAKHFRELRLMKKASGSGKKESTTEHKTTIKTHDELAQPNRQPVTQYTI